MLGQSLKKIFKIIIIFIVLSFGYALGAILFKWYPFELVKNAMIQSTINKYEIKSTNDSRYLFTSILTFPKILIFDSTQQEVSCPKQTNSVGVILAIGQSNSANSGEYRYSHSELPDVLNWYDGKCFKAQSPLLGASGINGEWISKTAQNLVDKGIYQKIVVISLGIGASQVASWAKEGIFNQRLIEQLKALSADYIITDIIWHQGETDLGVGVGQDQYFNSFRSLKKTINAQGIDAPLFISIASYCNGSDYPNNITSAQNQLASELNGVFLGVNTDKIVSSSMRFDDCHFNKQGQEAAAQELALIISKHHRN